MGQCLVMPHRLPGLAGPQQRGGVRQTDFRVIGRQGMRPRQDRRGGAIPVETGQREAMPEMPHRIVRAGAGRAMQAVRRFLEPLQPDQRHAAMKPSPGVGRIERGQGLEHGQRGGEILRSRVDDAEHIQRLAVRWIAGQDRLANAAGFRGPAGAMQRPGSFERQRVDGNGLGIRHPGQRRFLLLPAARAARDGQGIPRQDFSETGTGETVPWPGQGMTGQCQTDPLPHHTSLVRSFMA